jgi:hypothetical protein
MIAADVLSMPAADMTIRQHLAVNLMIPASGDDLMDRMIWEAKRDHVAAQLMASLLSLATPPDDVAAVAYSWADSLLAESGWDEGNTE